MAVGETLGGRWLLGEEAGRGGMGVVFQGKDVRTGARVAVKVLTGDANERVARFAAIARPTQGQAPGLCITRRPPFWSADPMVAISKILTPDAPPPSRFVHGIPPEVDALMGRMLAKRPDARFADGKNADRSRESNAPGARDPLGTVTSGT